MRPAPFIFVIPIFSFRPHALHPFTLDEQQRLAAAARAQGARAGLPCTLYEFCRREAAGGFLDTVIAKIDRDRRVPKMRRAAKAVR